VKGSEVIPYLLHDRLFPKSVAFCLEVITDACKCLPHNKDVIKKLKEIEGKLGSKVEFDTPGAELLPYFEQLQILLSSIHFIVSEAWFPAD
jgi:uncharacterized alpha-E superfamily protein